MTTQTLSNPTGAVPGILHEIGRFFGAMAAGVRAAREYERYNSKTDAALAREGISRQEIARAVYARNFGAL